MEEDCNSSLLDQKIDEAYILALDDDTWEKGEDLEADFKYAQALQLQEDLMSIAFFSKEKTFETAKVFIKPESTEVAAESSHSFCEICLEKKEHNEMFQNIDCKHSYCLGCMTEFVITKLIDRVSVITCPSFKCDVAVKIDLLGPLLPKDIVRHWNELLSRDAANSGNAVYCPYKDCSARMVFNDTDNTYENVREAECPMCHRLFCASCSVSWHAGLSCEDYQNLDEDERGADDMAVLKLAHAVNWGRCPNCRIYVERTEGCPHMTCRCGHQFCYKCGGNWNPKHHC